MDSKVPHQRQPQQVLSRSPGDELPLEETKVDTAEVLSSPAPSPPQQSNDQVTSLCRSALDFGTGAMDAYRRGCIESADESHQEALQACQKIQDKRAIIALNELGMAYTNRGYPNWGLEALRLAERYANTFLSSGHRAFPSIWNNMAQAFEALGEFKNAMSAYEKCVSVLVEVHGSDKHPQVAIVMHNVAKVLDQQGLHLRAIRVYQNVLPILQATANTRIVAAAALNNMGLAHGALRQPEQAGKAFAEAEAMYKRIAPESLGLADTFHNQATLLSSEGHFNQARLLYGKAAGVYDRVLGEGNLKSQASLRAAALTQL